MDGYGPWRSASLNFYLVTTAASRIVPTGRHPQDQEAMAMIAEAFPDREVVGVPGAIISFGGGGPHCITQQIPDGVFVA